MRTRQLVSPEPTEGDMRARPPLSRFQAAFGLFLFGSGHSPVWRKHVRQPNFNPMNNFQGTRGRARLIDVACRMLAGEVK